MRLRILAGGCGLLALLLPGCQCQEAASSAVVPAPAAVAVLDAPAGEELARRVCAVLQREPAQRRAACCGAGPERHLASECEAALASALARGSVRIDPTALEQCAAASAQAQRGCDWVTPGQPLPPPACRDLTTGAFPAGASCRSSLECQGSLHCSGSTPSEPGHCAAAAGAGSLCEPSADRLAAYLFETELERAHPTCAGSCSLLTRRCEPAALTATSVSAPERRQALAGAECQSDFDCGSGGCADGVCGMKCNVTFSSFAGPAAATSAATRPALAFRRRAAR